jgi:diguanylate cyclase (GGDEF)-like protein/PAS domain S-box-containing protein
LKILYAEDSLDLAEPIKMILSMEGHLVTHVENGAAAVEEYKRELPDLVLMDVMMPVMDGIEACKRIKAISTKKWIPIILLSGRDTNDDMVKGLEAGADDYLTKPIDFGVLAARMRSKQRVVDIQNSLIGILDNVHEGIITINQNGAIQSFNLAAERIFGYAPEEVIEKNVSMLMPEPYKSEHDGYLHHYMTTKIPKVIGVGSKKVKGSRKNGEIFPMSLAVTKVESSKEMSFIGLVRDISQEEEDRQHIEHLALHDPLTSLPNRAGFTQKLSDCIREQKPFALLFVDIDGFKPVNDNFGHDIGDKVLIAISQRMRGAVAGRDFIARLGGDEFVVILHDVSGATESDLIGARILEKIRAPMTFKKEVCTVGASIGVAFYPTHGKSGESLLSAADSAMYEAKRAGKNRVVTAK